MSRRTNLYSIVGTLCVLQFLVALVVAAGGCNWGVMAYVGSGLIVSLVLLSIPYVARQAFQRMNRLPAALGFALLGLVTWLFGWLIAFSRLNCS